MCCQYERQYAKRKERSTPGKISNAKDHHLLAWYRQRCARAQINQRSFTIHALNIEKFEFPACRKSVGWGKIFYTFRSLA